MSVKSDNSLLKSFRTSFEAFGELKKDPMYRTWIKVDLNMNKINKRLNNNLIEVWNLLGRS